MIRRRFLLRGARTIDPGSGLDDRVDLRIEAGRISAIGSGLEPGDSDEVVDLDGCLVTPGLMDVHVHLREPGGEIKETIATGARAAAAGGFTTVCAMPNTDPVIDTPERVAFVLERGRVAEGARVQPIAAATVGSAGGRPTDVGGLAAAGAVAVSDDGLPIESDSVFAEVLAAAAEAGIPLADHCEDRALAAGGAVFAGPTAAALGVRGIPPEAESDAVARDIEVLEREGGRLHLCHLSTAESVDLLRRARARGLAVTAEATPHHLVLTHPAVLQHGAAAKMNPPLATEADRLAVLEGVLDGTIDCIATDHAPHTPAEKAAGLAPAPFGIVGLETAFAVLYTALVVPGVMPLATLVERLTTGPARAFGLEVGRLEAGASADLAAFDLERSWTVEPERFRSLGRNTPWTGEILRGRPVFTVVDGHVAWDGRTSGVPVS